MTHATLETKSSAVTPVRRGLAIVVALASLAVAGLVAPDEASAATWYQVNPTRACQQQYGGGVFGASLYSWSPDGIYCYGASIPFGVTWIGTLSAGRIYWYCKAMYGSRADAKVRSGWRNPLNAWWCYVP